MVKKALAILFLVIPVLAFAQSRDTVFTVQAMHVSLLPETDVLYQNMSKQFKLVAPPSFQLDTILFDGGTYKRHDSLLILKPTKSKTVLLRIFQKQSDGNSKLVLAKEFGVQKFVEPRPNLDGVGTDSAIHRMKVVAQGYVNVPMRPDPMLKRFSYPVLSFDVDITDNGRVNTYTAKSNRMSYEMRDKIDSLGGGTSIDVRNIRYTIEEDTFIMTQPLRVFIINDTIMKF